MNSKQVYQILKNKEKRDIYYDDRPVWIQELNDNIATVGFVDNNEEREVDVEDLYEKWDGANQDKNVPKGTDHCNI